MSEHRRPTDADWLRTHLDRHAGEWVDLNAILRASIAERGCGLTVHSRAAELRARGFVVENRTKRTADGRVASAYRLVSVAVGEQARIEVAS